MLIQNKPLVCFYNNFIFFTDYPTYVSSVKIHFSLMCKDKIFKFKLEDYFRFKRVERENRETVLPLY